MQVAFYLAGEITQVLDAIPWVRCASGNVYLFYLFLSVFICFYIFLSVFIFCWQWMTASTLPIKQLFICLIYFLICFYLLHIFLSVFNMLLYFHLAVDDSSYSPHQTAGALGVVELLRRIDGGGNDVVE